MPVPWVMLAVATALSGGAVVLAAVEGDGGATAEAALGLVVVAAAGSVGALIESRRRGHAVGRLLCAFALSLAIGLAGSRYAAVQPRLAGHEWAAWLGGVLGGPAMVLAAAVLLVFPDGRLPSPRWRPVIWIAAAAVALIAAGFALSPPVEPGVDNPLGVELAEGGWLHQGALGWALVPVVLVAAAVSLIVRYRRAGADDRVRLKWLAVAAALAVPGWALTAESWEDPTVWSTLLTGLTTLAIPVAIGIAILRHRLFDIDLIIRRSLVYGALWLAIGALYVAVAAAVGIAAGRRLPVEAAILLTIAVTVAFQPARRRLDRIAGRLVFGDRPSRYEVLTQLGATLERSVDVSELAPRIAEAVRRGLDLRWARVLLELSAGEAVRLQPAGAAGVALDEPATPATTVALAHGAEQLGVIECGPKAEGELTERDTALLATLARQAALGIRSARLAAELNARLDEIRRQADELAASRARILHAQDTERRRIERDLHDGAQQHIVSLIAKLRIARNELARDPRAAAATLAELQDEARHLLNDLRELAHGIHPAVLSDRGLLEAIEARTARLPLPAGIEADPALRGARFAPEIEAGAYFFVAEALTNVVKHARAGTVTIALSASGSLLRVSVSDDGVGIEPGTGGSGLVGLRDRLEGLGGRLLISSNGSGACVAAELPLRERAHA